MDEKSDEKKDERMNEKVVVQKKNEFNECVSKSVTICIYLVVDNALHPKPLTLRDFSWHNNLTHIKWTTIFTIRRKDVWLRIRNDEAVEKKMISIEHSEANKAMKQKEKRMNCSIILGHISAYFVTSQVPQLRQSGSIICTIVPPPPLLFRI